MVGGGEMDAGLVLGRPAVGVRERMGEFVWEVTGGLSLARQRENALLYVRGLVEQGGRKSLQPTLFRLEETPARYESMQQFLADSPWDPGLLVRACAERVAPGSGWSRGSSTTPGSSRRGSTRRG